jgi:hypothetical protein
MPPDPPPNIVSGAERAFLDALMRAIRDPNGRVVIAVRLSHMRPPAPRPHHRRIIRALMQETARRNEGSTYMLANGDVVLLCKADGPHPANEAASATTYSPHRLPELLSRLLHVDAPDTSDFISVWPLAQTQRAALTYAAERAAEANAPAPADEAPSFSTSEIDAVAALVSGRDIQALMHRQTAITLLSVPGKPGGPAEQVLRPMYRELSFSMAAIDTRVRSGTAMRADPFLVRHLASSLDQRMIGVLLDQIGTGSALDLRLDRVDGHTVAPMHINLAPECVLSPTFAALTAACRAAGVSIGVEVSVIEACADPAAFMAACRTVHGAGMTVVLDGISYLTLLLSRPGMLGPDLLKLEWSNRLAELGEADSAQLRRAMNEIGVHRVILHRAGTEAALRWGVANGIRRFQGRHVDAMLAASRITSCPKASGCTLRQCVERARALSPAGRAGCRNLGLLDAGAPPHGPAARPAPTQRSGQGAAPAAAGAALRHNEASAMPP